MIPVPDLSYSGLMTILTLSLLLCLNLTWTTELNCDDVWISNAVSISLNIKRLSFLFSQTVFQQLSRSCNCQIPFAQSKHFSEADTISWSNMAYGYISGTSPYLVVSGWIRLWTRRCCSFSGNSSSPFLLLNSPTFYWWTSNCCSLENQTLCCKKSSNPQFWNPWILHLFHWISFWHIMKPFQTH